MKYLEMVFSIATPTSNSFAVSGLAANTNYSMAVRARDAAGNWSSQSSALSVTTSNAPPQTSNANDLGFNIGGPQDYSADRVFADVFRSAREWKKIGIDVLAFQPHK